MIRKWYNLFQIIAQLSKVKITVAVAFTTLTGFVLGNGSFSWAWMDVTLGIFLLASGASVINQIQEFKTDAAMNRTKDRPLPAGRISMLSALLIALVEIVAGSLILWFHVNVLAFALGWFALIWYNFIYTYLKRITPHAVIPGSVIGAIPPLVGWAASGAPWNQIGILALAVFFFIWQVPHFYLLVLKYGSEYEKAGMPALTSRYSEYTIRIIILLWVILTAVAAIFLYFSQLLHSTVGMLSIIISSIWLVIEFLIPVIRRKNEFSPFAYFMRINYYVLYIIVLLNLDHLLSRHIL